jgi:hypothetical protein
VSRSLFELDPSIASQAGWALTRSAELLGLVTRGSKKRGEHRIEIIDLLKEAGAPESRICENGRDTNYTVAATSVSSAPLRYLTKTMDYRPKFLDQRAFWFSNAEAGRA